MSKTNALRILDQRKIKYEQVEYTYDPENLSIENIAKVNKLDISTIFKTLVAKGDRSGVLVAVVPGDAALDMKALAKASRNRKITLLPIKEILSITGYVRGACSPIGMKKNFPVYIDQKASQLKKMYVNAGERGILFGVTPDDLQMLTRAQVLPISKESEE